MIALLLALAQIELAPEGPKPIETTVAAIRANPAKFDGEIVRLHGWVNQCQHLSCHVSERAATDPAGAGEELSIAEDPKFDAVIQPLLPTYVEFDAQFSAACLTTAACSDRAPMLTIITLRGVVSPEPPPFQD
jgi:hypothetical protein